MDTPSWQSLVGFGVFAASWAVGNNKPLDWNAVFPIGGATIGIVLIAQNQFARSIDKLIERDCFQPPVTPQPAQPQETGTRVTTGNINIPVETGEFQPYHSTKPATIGLKQTRQGWSLTGLGKRKHQLTAEMVAMQKTTDSLYARPDSEMLVAGRLIVQRNNNLPVDLRESYWVRRKHWPESADKFRRMLSKWTYHGMIERQGTNGNSTYVVVNWKKVRGVANGVALPPPPDGFKS
jgi:hypothetical protein